MSSPLFALEALVGGAEGDVLADEDRRLVEELGAATLQGNVVYIGSELAKPWTRAWIARPASGGSPIGFLVAWHVADELHVLGIAVDVAQRRMGLGLALMAEAQAYARRCSIRLLLLEVRRSNRAAIRLYRRLRYSAMGIRPGYYADGEDALEMMLVLDPVTGEVVPSPDEIHLEC
jgi:ribosomal-protein-alanine N-acetyltransferase